MSIYYKSLYIFKCGLVLVACFVFTASTYEERNEKYREQIVREVERKHELALAKIEFEAYARELAIDSEYYE